MGMESKAYLEMIIQGGAVGLCALMVLINYRRDKMFNKTINNHLEHNNVAIEKSAETNIKLAESLQQLSDNISRCSYNK